jgi:hypothetical protein
MPTTPSQEPIFAPSGPTTEAAQETAPIAGQRADAAGLTEADLALLTAALPAIERLHERLRSVCLALHLQKRTKREHLDTEDVEYVHRLIDAGFSASEIAAELGVTVPAVQYRRKKYLEQKLASMRSD